MKVNDYGDMWHFVMDEIIDVENRKVDHLDATKRIMDKFAELLENNGMDIKNIPTIKDYEDIIVTDHEDGSATVEMDGEAIHYTKEEVDEMMPIE
jgi:hypothetical protein